CQRNRRDMAASLGANGKRPCPGVAVARRDSGGLIAVTDAFRKPLLHGPTLAAGHGGKNMEYRTLGRTGVRVSTYALGTMMFGADGNRDEKECIDIVHAALEAGINLIDTADTYSHGESEEFVG